MWKQRLSKRLATVGTHINEGIRRRMTIAPPRSIVRRERARAREKDDIHAEVYPPHPPTVFGGEVFRLSLAPKLTPLMHPFGSNEP